MTNKAGYKRNQKIGACKNIRQNLRKIPVQRHLGPGKFSH